MNNCELTEAEKFTVYWCYSRAMDYVEKNSPNDPVYGDRYDLDLIVNGALGFYHTDALGGMAINLRTVFKDLISPPVPPKPAELTLDEKVDDLIDELMKDSRTMAIKKLKRMLNERL